jgi:hypothetical protein
MTQEQIDESSKIVSVSVPAEMKTYLDNHPKINRSKLFQDAVNALRFPQAKKLSPATNLLCFMGIVGGLVIALFSIVLQGLTGQKIDIFFLVGLILMGMALSLGSFLTIMRARKLSKLQQKQEQQNA